MTSESKFYDMGAAFQGVRYSALADLFMLWSEVDHSLDAIAACLRDTMDIWLFVRKHAPKEDLLRHPIEPEGVTPEDIESMLLAKDPMVQVNFIRGLRHALHTERVHDRLAGREDLTAKLGCILWDLHFLEEELLVRSRADLSSLVDACAGGAG